MRIAPNRRRTLVLLAGALLGLLGAAPAARAHKLDITVTFPKDRPSQVKVEANYDDGDPAPDARCTLLDGRGAEIAADSTGADGACYFTRPPVGRYTVVVDDGDGHRSRLEFAVSEDLAADRDATNAIRRGPALFGGLTLIGLMFLVLRRARRLPPPSPPMPGT